MPTSGAGHDGDLGADGDVQHPGRAADGGPHKLAVMVSLMGHEEDGGANDSFKNARGLTSATFTGSTAPIAWKIQGNQGGEDITDTVRGFVNESGLYGERAGWNLAGLPGRELGTGHAAGQRPEPGPSPGTARRSTWTSRAAPTPRSA